MFDFHQDRKRYFDMQILNTEKYVLPFIEQIVQIKPGMRVLEVGAGEAGVLKAFVNKGCVGVAVEMLGIRVENGKKWLKDDVETGRIRFFVEDIYLSTNEQLGGPFDLIVLKDVIEHIHDQQRLLATLQTYLKPDGFIYFGFPPWQMPFGGHQQMCQFTPAKLPYIHLLPNFLYTRILKHFNEHPETISFLMETKETGISIERFERISKQTGYRIAAKKHYLVNPIYEWKFGWKPREQYRVIRAMPFLRDFFTTCVYYLIRKED